MDADAHELATQEDTDEWFDTSSDPEIAKAVAEARAVANKPVDSSLDEKKPASPAAEQQNAIGNHAAPENNEAINWQLPTEQPPQP